MPTHRAPSSPERAQRSDARDGEVDVVDRAAPRVEAPRRAHVGRAGPAPAAAAPVPYARRRRRPRRADSTSRARARELAAGRRADGADLAHVACEVAASGGAQPGRRSGGRRPAAIDDPDRVELLSASGVRGRSPQACRKLAIVRSGSQ